MRRQRFEEGSKIQIRNVRKVSLAKFKMSFLLAVAAAFWLAVASAQAQEKLEKIYVGVAGLSGALAHAFIPKDSGLYEKYGLDVELISFKAAPRRSSQRWPAAFKWS
jgi:ABC-type proline/glycine betaine transport system substrate-binding protein